MAGSMAGTAPTTVPVTTQVTTTAATATVATTTAPVPAPAATTAPAAEAAGTAPTTDPHDRAIDGCAQIVVTAPGTSRSAHSRAVAAVRVGNGGSAPGYGGKAPGMQIDKDQILQLLRSQGDEQKA